jgi:hypothetical protein
VNCNEVIQKDRCACNERVLRALTQSRPGIVDPTQAGSAGEANAVLAIQQERNHRLRTYYAPGCKDPSSPEHLPIPPQHTGSWHDRETIEKYLQPPGTQTIDPMPRPGVGGYINPEVLLVGRWEGWETLAGNRSSPISFHVIAVDGQGTFVKACSDQSLVFGRVKDGYLEFPRTDAYGVAYSVLLWRSAPPHSQDLEGVTMLEVRPGKVAVAGLVWLSRAVRFDWTSPPSSYFCQDRDLEEQRKDFLEKQENRREENEAAALMQLKKQVEELKGELDALKREREGTRSRSTP